LPFALSIFSGDTYGNFYTANSFIDRRRSNCVQIESAVIKFARRPSCYEINSRSAETTVAHIKVDVQAAVNAVKNVASADPVFWNINTL